MTIYDVLCQWNKETEIVIKCRKLSWRLSQIVVTFFLPSPSRRPLLDFTDISRAELKVTDLRWRRQIWRVAGRESGSPELLGSPRTSPEVPRTSPAVFRRLPRKFSHCGTQQQSRASPEVSQTSPEVPQTSPEVTRTFPEVSPFLWEAWHPLLTHKNFLWQAKVTEPNLRFLRSPANICGYLRESAVFCGFLRPSKKGSICENLGFSAKICVLGSLCHL